MTSDTKKKKKAKSRTCLEGRAVPPFGYGIKPSGEFSGPVTLHSSNRQSLFTQFDSTRSILGGRLFGSKRAFFLNIARS